MSINGGETNQNNHELSEITSTPRGRKLTTHAREILPRHGFTEPFSLVDEIIDNYTRSSTQRDGAIVYIQQAEKPNPLAPFPTREGGTGNLAPLSEEIAQMVVENQHLKLLIFDANKAEVVKWIE